MKRLFTILLATLLLSSGISSCGMKGPGIPANKQDYIGDWQAEGMYIEITRSGNVDYRFQKGNITVNFSAPISRFKGDDFEIDALGVTTLFHVTEKPHEEDGVWKMTVNDVELTRE